MPYVVIDPSGHYLWGSKGGWVRIDDQPQPPACYKDVGDARSAADEVKRLTGQDARAEVISAAGGRKR